MKTYTLNSWSYRFKIVDEKGVEEEFIIKEATGDIVRQFKNMQLSHMLHVDGFIRPGPGMADTTSYLVSMCTYVIKKEEGSIEKPIRCSLDRVRSWSETMIKELYDLIRDNSGMNDQHTIEGLIKQRDELNERIEKMQNEKKTEDEELGNL